MPKNSPVHHIYEALLGKGYDKGKAARIAQSMSGMSLMTGKRPKGAHGKKKRGGQ